MVLNQLVVLQPLQPRSRNSHSGALGGEGGGQRAFYLRKFTPFVFDRHAPDVLKSGQPQRPRLCEPGTRGPQTGAIKRRFCWVSGSCTMHSAAPGPAVSYWAEMRSMSIVGAAAAPFMQCWATIPAVMRPCISWRRSAPITPPAPA